MVKKKYNNETLLIVKINPQFMSEDDLFKFQNISNIFHFLLNMFNGLRQPMNIAPIMKDFVLESSANWARTNCFYMKTILKINGFHPTLN
jgi:hypothetical protein